jgi:lysophosphatidate acyltransferase
MGKKELFWAPLLGQYMWMAGSIFIDRSNNKQAVQSLKEAGDELKRKSTSLWMFPEGTRTSQEVPNLRPFKKGAFHLAVNAQIPIIPVVCENYWRLYHKGVFEGDRLKIRGAS